MSTISGLQLKRGGADKKAIERLNARKVSIGYQTVKKKQTEFGEKFDEQVHKWAVKMEGDKELEKQLKAQVKDIDEIKEGALGVMATAVASKALDHAKSALDRHMAQRHPGYRIVGDNVDHKVKPRHMTTTNTTTDHHHFHMFAVENRVSGMHLDDSAPITPHKELDIANLLPSAKDNQMLRHTWCVLSGRIISKYIPEMNWMNQYLPSIAHNHMKEAKTKSSIVSIMLCTQQNSYSISHLLATVTGR